MLLILILQPLLLLLLFVIPPQKLLDPSPSLPLHLLSLLSRLNSGVVGGGLTTHLRLGPTPLPFKDGHP